MVVETVVVVVVVLVLQLICRIENWCLLSRYQGSTVAVVFAAVDRTG